jgi:lysyl-tRNA synthetase class 2
MANDSDLEGQMQQRIAAAETLRGEGIHPYANDFRVTHQVHELPADLTQLGPEDSIAPEATRYAIAGRLVQVNEMGKARFLFLRGDRGEMVQLYVKADNAAAFTVAKKLDLGDFVGVRGPLFKTRKEKRALKAEELRLLTKTLRPLPGKVLQEGHDVTDVGLLYRQRYLDLIMHPEKAEVFRKRGRIVTGIRKFFDERGYVECETRMLLSTNGGATARPFTTHHNALDIDLFLRIAPELYLKRLVVGGLERVYEINRNFRNEGISTRHNPEFTMLEFYQAYSDYQDLMTLTEEMIGFVARAATGKDEIEYDGQTISLRAPFARVSLRQAAAEAASKKLGVTIADRDLREDASVRKLADRLGIGVDPKIGAGKITTTIFETLVEESLVQPTFVYDFPTEVSPLSKQRPDDPDTVERFELYIGTMEVANAFSELNDPAEQKNRFEQQLAERAKGNQEAHAMDEDYVRALEYGLPPTAGEGVGIDRLVMLLTDSKSIRDVILFPQMKPRGHAV